jgi:tRNA A37 threonylcarbamoyladenosine modification protein TsaB
MEPASQSPTLAILGGNPDGLTAFSVAVRTAQGVFERTAPVKARVDLAELVRLALHDAAIAPTDIRQVRVDQGPGSYIGLRVAVTFARCFAAFAAGACELLAADSLAAAAVAAIAADPTLAGKRIAIAIDGRQGRVQFARFCSIEGATLATEAKPQLLLDADAIAGLAHADVAFADPAALQRLAPAGTPHALRAIPAVSATALLDPRMPLYAASLHELEPLYLTGSYVGG